MISKRHWLGAIAKEHILIYQTSLGEIHHILGNYKKALNFFRRSIQMRESSDIEGRAKDHNNISLVLKDLGELEEALDNINQAIYLNSQIENKKGQARDIRDRSVILRESGNLKEAIEEIDKSIKLDLELSNIDGLAQDYRNKAVASERTWISKDHREMHYRGNNI